MTMESIMRPRDRMLAALDLNQPDRVPVWEQAFNEESIIRIARHFTSDLPPLKPVSDMTLEEKAGLFGALCTLVESLDLDGITLLPLGRTEKIGEKLIRDGNGVVYRLSDHGSPYDRDYHTGRKSGSAHQTPRRRGGLRRMVGPTQH